MLIFLLIPAVIAALGAARAPNLMNYQGVLRATDDRPLSGDYDMVFRFFDAETGGNEVLVDSHLGAGSGAVSVSGGLFSVQIGAGAVTDGSGPGTYTLLYQVFRDHQHIWLSVEIGGEILDPRVPVVSAPYALNADMLRGRSSTYFINTGGGAQSKSGLLTVDTTGDGTYGIEVYGDEAAGFFKDANDSAEAHIADRDTGVWAKGSKSGGHFADSNDTGYGYVGAGDAGVRAWGTEAGGYFEDEDDGSFAWVGYGDYGIWAESNLTAGVFQGTGISSRGISASGQNMGGYFADSNESAYAQVAYGDLGIRSFGQEAGGYFADSATSANTSARIAYTGPTGEQQGIWARGRSAGGFFEDQDESGHAYLGIGDTGIEAFGDYNGAYFESSGYGIEAWGEGTGGYFHDLSDSGRAYVGIADYGIKGYGNDAGGYFESSGVSPTLSKAYLGRVFSSVGYGVWGEGSSTGGYFLGDAYGVRGYGDTYGGQFTDQTSGNYGRVGYASYKIYGTGSMSFVQNHPAESDKVIVYAAPEGDEVATYTRGTAQLEGGWARVSLGETFKWVTNPDIGLTAQVTPRGDCRGIYVEELSTEELTVRELDGGTSDAVFDFVVHGLRIGFEETSVVQLKETEAYIPSMEDHRALYASHPELRRYNAIERFKDQRVALGMQREPDQEGAQALRGAVQEFDRNVHELPGQVVAAGERYDPVEEMHPRDAGDSLVAASPATRLPVDDQGNVYGRSFRSESADLASLFPVAAPVEPGDVVVLDPELPGLLRPSTLAADPALVGVVAAEAGLILGADQKPRVARPSDTFYDETLAEADPATTTLRAPVVFTGVVFTKVDAGYGSIRSGDLLTTSPTEGHAMRANDPLPGVVLGKAIDPLDTGTGLIRVLVMLR
jgi:hypothetical protein